MSNGDNHASGGNGGSSKPDDPENPDDPDNPDKPDKPDKPNNGDNGNHLGNAKDNNHVDQGNGNSEGKDKIHASSAAFTLRLFARSFFDLPREYVVDPDTDPDDDFLDEDFDDFEEEIPEEDFVTFAADSDLYGGVDVDLDMIANVMLIPNGEDGNLNPYELTGYINDINRANTETLMEYTELGNFQAAYTYGVNRESMVMQGYTGYYHYDGRGSVANITGLSGETMVSYIYTDFGVDTAYPGAKNPYRDNPYRYNGERLDYIHGAPDLQFLRARYYDAASGRFTSRDTYWGKINVPLSQHLYTYTMNNPVKYADPSGHYVEEKQAYLDQIASLNEQISSMQNVMYSSGLSTRSAIQDELDRLNRSLASSRNILAMIEGQMSYQEAFPKQDRMIQAANAASMRVSCDVNPSVRHIDPWQSAWDEVYEDNWWWINSVLSIYEVGRDTGAMIHKNDLTVRFGEDPTWENGLLMAGDLLTGHVISTGWNYLLSPHVDRASAWIKDPLDSGKFMNMWTAGISDILSGVFVPPEGVVPGEWYGSTDWYKHVYSSALIVYGGYKTIQMANTFSVRFENKTHQFKSPNSRHYYAKITQGTRTKELNTVIMPNVDVSSDVLAINAGKSIKVGDSYLVNNRIYRVHDGTLYPVSGEGFYQLDRGAYNALGIYKKFGNTQHADEILLRMQMTDEAKNKALEVYRAGGGK